MKKCVIFPLCLMLSLCFNAFAQKMSPKQLSSTLDKMVAAEFPAKGTGCAVLVAEKGKILYKKGFGMANLELEVPMKPEMVFRIGSITKQFTAICILQLLEQGKLSLEDDITKYIPDYRTDGNKITIENLLTHTSGIPSYTEMDQFDTLSRTDMEPLEFIAMFKNEALNFAPNTKWEYSNSGYFILGYIIEKVSGKTYADYVEEMIFKPLGMNNSYYGYDSKIIKNRASGYQMGEKGLENAEFLSMTLPYAAGSLVSTVEDLYKWNLGVQAYKMVKKETLAKAFTDHKLINGKSTHYGFGWGLNEMQESPTIEHDGGINGFLSSAIYLPKEEIFVSILSNSMAKSPANLAEKVAAIALGKPYNLTEKKIEGMNLTDFVGVYENEDMGQRMITTENGKFYSQRKGGPKLNFSPYEKDKFFFEGGMTKLIFEREANGKVKSVLSKHKNGNYVWQKTDKEVPTHKEIALSADVLAQYVGEYAIEPTFLITITTEGNRVFAQATGQNRFEIFAESETMFFVKVVDAQIEFVKGENAQVKSLILHQGSENLEGKKVK